MEEKLIAKLESDLKLPEESVDLTKLTDEQRERAFILFGEGSKELTNFLRTAYAHGAPSIFACSGHGISQPYVLLRVTDKNLPMLQYLGKVLSNFGASTNFEDHYQYGKRVHYGGTNDSNNSCEWLNTATDVLEHPNLYVNEASNPTIYYHEAMTDSYVPLGYKVRKKILETLKKHYSMKLYRRLPDKQEEVGRGK